VAEHTEKQAKRETEVTVTEKAEDAAGPSSRTAAE
jgi:hypothetical protein